MIELSAPVSAFGFAPGIAEADRVGANASAQAANPINKKRFTSISSSDRVIAAIDNASTSRLFR
jgi:hypothetical protein